LLVPISTFLTGEFFEEDKAKPIVLQKKQDTPKDEVPLPAIFEFGISDLDNEDH